MCPRPNRKKLASVARALVGLGGREYARNAVHIKEATDLLEHGFTRAQPKFEGIDYDWYVRAGLLDDVDVYLTFDTMDWATIGSKFGICGLKDVFERMDEDAPEDGRGLNFAGSSEIILIHDLSETANLFEPIIKKLLDKGLKFELAPI